MNKRGCVNCNFASWSKTKTGRNSYNKCGECKFTIDVEEILNKIPSAVVDRLYYSCTEKSAREAFRERLAKKETIYKGLGLNCPVWERKRKDD